MKGSPSIQKAKSLSPQSQSHATGFNSRTGAAKGTTGGKNGRGAQYADEGFTHNYNESAAIGIVKSLHRK